MLFGLMLHPWVVGVGILIFSAVLLFQLITLPVEFNATSRAKRLIVQAGIVDQDERYGIDRVLNAAALTYVAAVIGTLLTILYFLLRSGLLHRAERLASMASCNACEFGLCLLGQEQIPRTDGPLQVLPVLVNPGAPTGSGRRRRP